MMTVDYKKTSNLHLTFVSVIVTAALLSSSYAIFPSAFAVPHPCLGNVDFDTFPDSTVPPAGTRITNQYVPCGVALFTTEVPAGPEIFNFGVPGKSPPNVLGADGPASRPAFTYSIGVQFVSPVSDASIKALDVSFNGLILEAFNSANVLVDTVTVINPSPGNLVDIMSVSDPAGDIVKLLIRQVTPGGKQGFLIDGYNIDDLTFTPTTPPNQAPDCSEATPSTASLFPPNHKMNDISIDGITDPDGDTVTITIDAITQDEPTNGLGDGDTSPDGDGVGTDTAQVRAERAGIGDGRVYEISFTADDGNGGTCTGSVFVGVPHDKKDTAVDSGQNFDSTQ